MNPKLEKLIEKKKMQGHMMSPVEQRAKSGVLEHLMQDMDENSMDKLNNLKKVTVAANSKPGLEEGLSKAKQMLGGEESSEMEDESEGMEDPSEEGMEHELAEHEMKDQMSQEEMMEKIKELEAKLSMLGA